MSGINIQNVLDQLSTLAGAADSTQSVDYLSDLSNAVLQANNLTGVIEYPSRRELPTPVDSSILGKIFYIPPRADYANDPSPRSSDSGGYDSAGGVDPYGAFYYGKELSDLDSGYERIRTTKDDGPGSSYSFQGSTSGYISGAGIAPTFSNVIEKFSFTSDGNASDVGDLTVTRGGAAGQSSSTHGYSSGGAGPSSPSALNVIDKFSFSVDGNATDAGDLSQARYLVTGQTSSTHGYSSGGYTKAYPGTRYNNIDKFPLSSDGNATDVGDMTEAGHSAAGASSTTHGYNAGRAEPSVYNIIDKFSFSVDGNATDVGDLATTLHSGAGNSSTTHGYSSGGRVSPSSNSNVIQKYPFSSDGNATDVGDLTVTRAYLAGQSSTTHGYSSGGNPQTNVIDKFSFTSDGNATDVGDATISERARTGQQV